MEEEPTKETHMDKTKVEGGGPRESSVIEKKVANAVKCHIQKQ